MLSLSTVKDSDTIAVVGPQSLEYFVALFRLGFDCAACISGDGPYACGEPIDHLFVSGPLADQRLAMLVDGVAPRLRPDGTIVAQLREAGQDRVISRALGAAGLFGLPPIFDGGANLLVSHHLGQPDRLAIAA